MRHFPTIQEGPAASQWGRILCYALRVRGSSAPDVAGIKKKSQAWTNGDQDGRRKAMFSAVQSLIEGATRPVRMQSVDNGPF